MVAFSISLAKMRHYKLLIGSTKISRNRLGKL